MTKIGKTMITVKGEIHPVEIHYNRERKFFYRGVPDEVIALSSFRNRDYASEKELTQALSIALEQYHEKIKVQRKMILYTLFGSSALIRERIEQGMYGGQKEGVSSKFETLMYAQYLFGFNFDILLEVSEQRVEYYYMKEDGTAGRRMSRPFNSQMCLIEWTPQREQFFRDMASQLQKLICSVSEFFDKPNMLELIDNEIVRLLK